MPGVLAIENGGHIANIDPFSIDRTEGISRSGGDRNFRKCALASDDMSRLINNSLGALNADRTWRKISEFVFICSPMGEETESIEYDIMTGKMTKSSIGYEVETPSAILRSSEVQKATNFRLPKTMSMLSPNTYAFQSQGTEFLIEMQRNNITIYKKIDDVFFQYIDLEKIRPQNEAEVVPQISIQSALLKDNNIWIAGNAEKQHIRIESKDGTLLYTTDTIQQLLPTSWLSGLVGYASSDIAKSLSIVLGEHSFILYSVKEARQQILPSQTLPDYFLQVEDRDYIVPLSDDGEHITTLSFPRLGNTGLRFVFDRKSQVYRNAENSSEVLLGHQYVQATPHLQHKLVLKNTKTNTVNILIPGHQLVPMQTQKSFLQTLGISKTDENSALDTRCSFELSKDLQNIPIYSYKKEKEQLIPETNNGAIYLAYSYLWQQQYEDSARVLENLPHLPLSQESIKILRWMMEDKSLDHDPRSIAIRLKANVIKLKNNILNG